MPFTISPDRAAQVIGSDDRHGHRLIAVSHLGQRGFFFHGTPTFHPYIAPSGLKKPLKPWYDFHVKRIQATFNGNIVDSDKIDYRDGGHMFRPDLPAGSVHFTQGTDGNICALDFVCPCGCGAVGCLMAARPSAAI